MPTADSSAAKASSGSKALNIPKVDPSTARYAALEAAAKSSPGAAKAIAKAQTAQMKAAPNKLAPTQYGSFMNTAGYNAGHSAPASSSQAPPPPSTLTYQDIRDAQGTSQQQFVQDTYNGVAQNTVSAPAPRVEARPATPAPAPAPPAPIRVATPEVILINQETLPVDLMTNMIFESIGGQELLSLSRHDLISGSSLQFQPISNLSDIAVQNNSHNIIPMPDSSNAYFNSFPIKLDTHIIESYGDLDTTHIYLDKVNNQLILKLTGLKSGEQVEVEILSSITTFNDTIYQRTIL